jgi:opacity protein-like surface antigen
MKRFLAIAFLAVFLPSAASAATWVFKRSSSFPAFGQARTIYNNSGNFNYPHSKTIAEKREVLPYRYQAGFCQRDPYMPKPKRVYQIEVP